VSKWIAEFELEDGDTMPEHMDLEYRGARIDFHCKPLEQEPIDYKTQYENYLKKSGVVISQLRADRDRLQDAFDKLRAEVELTRKMYLDMNDIDWLNGCDYVLSVIDKYKAEIKPQESEKT
jgi:hypothetical protein